jgi:UDP-4-amino-4,6-dideoxy-N-acetyl-beta-L-altrosamine N-acetyltransferase
MISFKKIRKLDLEIILNWRISPDVSRFMKTDIENNLAKQLEWYEKFVKIHQPPRHWIINFYDRQIGYISLEEYDEVSHETSWGFYIGELDAWNIGGVVPAYFYNYIFLKRNLNLKKVTGHAFSNHLKILKLHKYYGCEEVGTIKDAVMKNGINYDITKIEMTRDKWLLQKNKFGNLCANFEE